MDMSKALKYELGIKDIMRYNMLKGVDIELSEIRGGKEL